MDDEVLDSLSVERIDVVKNIGLKPGIFGSSAAALVDKLPALSGYAEPFSNEATGFGELPFIVAAFCHRTGNAMRGESDVSGFPRRGRELLERLLNPIKIRGNESRVVVVDPHLVAGWG